MVLLMGQRHIWVMIQQCREVYPGRILMLNKGVEAGESLLGIDPTSVRVVDGRVLGTGRDGAEYTVLCTGRDFIRGSSAVAEDEIKGVERLIMRVETDEPGALGEYLTQLKEIFGSDVRARRVPKGSIVLGVSAKRLTYSSRPVYYHRDLSVWKKV